MHRRWLRWPTRCAVCRSWSGDPLCPDCEQRFGFQGTRCRRCALPLQAPTGTCGRCLTKPPDWDAAVCAEHYAFPWDGLIGQLKFEGRTERIGLLTNRLLTALDHFGTGPHADLVLPIPLSDARLRERGFNQAWEIARRVARALGRPARSDVLVRQIHTSPQAGLSRAARATNLQGAFAVPLRRQTWVAGRHVALVDDIMTTGATFGAASQALRRAGAATVSVWAVARTPEPTLTSS